MVRWSVERRFVGSVPVEAFDTFSGGGELWRVVVVLLGSGLLEKPEDLSDVLVSPSSVVTEFVTVSSVARSGNLWNRSPFLSSKKKKTCHIVVKIRRKR